MSELYSRTIWRCWSCSPLCASDVDHLLGSSGKKWQFSRLGWYAGRRVATFPSSSVLHSVDLGWWGVGCEPGCHAWCFMVPEPESYRWLGWRVWQREGKVLFVWSSSPCELLSFQDGLILNWVSHLEMALSACSEINQYIMTKCQLQLHGIFIYNLGQCFPNHFSTRSNF